MNIVADAGVVVGIAAFVAEPRAGVVILIGLIIWQRFNNQHRDFDDTTEQSASDAQADLQTALREKDELAKDLAVAKSDHTAVLAALNNASKRNSVMQNTMMAMTTAASQSTDLSFAQRLTLAKVDAATKSYEIDRYIADLQRQLRHSQREVDRLQVMGSIRQDQLLLELTSASVHALKSQDAASHQLAASLARVLGPCGNPVAPSNTADPLCPKPTTVTVDPELAPLPPSRAPNRTLPHSRSLSQLHSMGSPYAAAAAPPTATATATSASASTARLSEGSVESKYPPENHHLHHHHLHPTTPVKMKRDRSAPTKEAMTRGWYTGCGSAAGLKVRVELHWKKENVIDVHIWSSSESLFPSRMIADVACNLSPANDFMFGPQLMTGLMGTVVTAITGKFEKNSTGRGIQVPLCIGLKVSRMVPHFTLKAILVAAKSSVGRVVRKDGADDVLLDEGVGSDSEDDDPDVLEAEIDDVSADGAEGVERGGESVEKNPRSAITLGPPRRRSIASRGPTEGWYTGCGKALGIKTRVEIHFRSPAVMDVYVWSPMESQFKSRSIMGVACSLQPSHNLIIGPELMRGLNGTVVTAISASVERGPRAYVMRLNLELKLRLLPKFHLKAKLRAVSFGVGGVSDPRSRRTRRADINGTSSDVQCGICFAANQTCFFGCKHGACEACAATLTSCPFCLRAITQRSLN